MQIGSSFTIPAPPDEVFDRFLDSDTMRSCIPGCHGLERMDDLHYEGQLVNEVAHVRFNARFSAEIVELERPHLVRAVLTGEDRRLGSSVKLIVRLGVEPDGESASAVSYEMDLALWGKLGRLGEPIVRRRSVDAERDFIAAFKGVFEPQHRPAPEPVGARSAGLLPMPGSGAAGSPIRASSRRMLLLLLQWLRGRLDRWIEALG